MLPGLSGLCISNSEPPRQVRNVCAFKLQDLPDVLLSKVVKETGNNARALCDTVDALARTSTWASGMSAWQDIAQAYSMPGRPKSSEPDEWRKFVMSWCKKIKPGVDGFGVAYVNQSLRSALLSENDKEFEWIVKTAGMDNIPLNCIREYIGWVVYRRLDTRLMEIMWGKQMPLPHNKTANGELLARASKIGNVRAAVWIFTKLLAEADVAIPAVPSAAARLEAAGLAEYRENMKKDVTLDAYRDVNECHYMTIVPALELVRSPSRDDIKGMIASAWLAAREREAISMMIWVDARYTITASEAQNIMGNEVLVDVQRDARGKLDLLEGWMARESVL